MDIPAPVSVSRRTRIAACGAAGMIWATVSSSAVAQDDDGAIPSNTVVTAENFDRLAARTFEGTTLGEMIPERFAWQIQTQGATVSLGKRVPRAEDPRVQKANERYAGSVKFDASTQEISGYITGTPFPEVDLADPHAGSKLLWNVHYASSRKTAPIMWAPLISFVLIDGSTGVERIQTWELKEKYYVGTVENLDHPSRGTIHSRALFRAVYPQDIKGIGTLTIRYTTGAVDDLWAYVRAVRRVRRLSGGAWHDNLQGGFDALQDDVGGWNGYPTWYPEHKFLGRVTGLVMANLPPAAFNPDGGTLAEQYPTINTSQPPYWHSDAVHSPRELYVVEVTTPVEHPYSRKIVYFDTKLWNVHYAEAYDRKGDFWRWVNIGSAVYQDAANPSIAYEVPSTGQFVDYQNRHASWFVTGPGLLMNPPDIDDATFSLAELEAGGR